MLNNHVIKTWPVTQASIALSSGEAEYCGVFMAAAQAIGVRPLLEDLNVTRRICVRTDASVAKSIATRKGAGKVRHIEVNQLWLQQRVANGDVAIEKCKTDENIADLLTKHQGSDAISKHLKWTRAKIGGERSSEMPNLSTSGINLLEVIDCKAEK